MYFILNMTSQKQICPSSTGELYTTIIRSPPSFKCSRRNRTNLSLLSEPKVNWANQQSHAANFVHSNTSSTTIADLCSTIATVTLLMVYLVYFKATKTHVLLRRDQGRVSNGYTRALARKDFCPPFTSSTTIPSQLHARIIPFTAVFLSMALFLLEHEEYHLQR